MNPSALESNDQQHDQTVEEGIARRLSGGQRAVLAGVAICWSLFQLAIATPWVTPDAIYIKSAHLAFALALIFPGAPLLRRAAGRWARLAVQDRVPLHDWITAIIAVAAALYIVFDYDGIARRLGAPLKRDVIAGVILLALLLEGCRRAIGPALSILALLFTLYAFFAEQLPALIATRAVSLERYVGQMTLSDEGVFGLPLHVSARTVFLFVLFGAMLERAGGGRFFTQLALSVLGGFRGGPAKAAVVGSALTGMISGSSIANIVTTGTFTIPLMKKAGYPARIAAAIEVAASTNGQLAPPIMGAAAFIIAEYVNVPFIAVMKAAAVPAFASYATLFYITHLEACKFGLRRVPRAELPRFWPTLLGGIHFLIPLTILLWLLIVEMRTPETAALPACLVLIALIVFKEVERALIAAPARQSADDWRALLRACWIDAAGLLTLLALLILNETRVFPISVTRSSSVALLMMAALIAARAVYQSATLESFTLEAARIRRGFSSGVAESLRALEAGGRNMAPVALACAGAGIIVGVVNLGLGGRITQVVDQISGGNVYLLLAITALASLIIGMGLPTTATYITMASLTAMVIVQLAAKHELLIPLMAAHLFVFYFGILADDTPPVGLAAYAAAAIAKSPPVATGVTGFLYDARTAVLPFMFVLNPDLILHGVDRWPAALLIFASAGIGCCAFAAATLGWFQTRNRWYECLLLLLAAFIMLRPDAIAHWLNFTPAQRYWALVPGALLLAGLYGWQKWRAAPPAELPV